MEDEKYQKLKDYGLKLLSIRPRSKKEFSGKLSQFVQKKNLPQNLIDELLKEFIELNLLNDFEFSKWWIDQRRSFRPKGEKVIRLELLHKGVEKEVIESAVDDISSDGPSDYDLALKVIEKRLTRYHNLSPIQLKIKIRDFLLRRGFGWEIISKVIDSLVNKS